MVAPDIDSVQPNINTNDKTNKPKQKTYNQSTNQFPAD